MYSIIQFFLLLAFIAPIFHVVLGDDLAFDPRNRPRMRGIANRQVQMPCTLQGGQYEVQPAKINWLRNGEKITSDGRHTLHWGDQFNTLTMTIEPANVSDEGSYTCVAMSRAGHVISK